MITSESPSAPDEQGRDERSQPAAGRHRRGRVAAAAATAAMLTALPAALAGCGSASSTANAASGGTCPSPGVSGNTIKIGLVYSDTGSQYADTFRAVRSAVDARVGLQNAAGGIHGRQVQVVWRDDHADPGIFRGDAQQLVNVENVFGLIVESTAARPTLQWLEDNGVPATGVAVGADPAQYTNLFSYKSIFSGQNARVDTFGQYVRAGGGTKAFVISDPTTPSAASLVAAFVPSLQSQGVQIVGQIDYVHGPATPAHIVDLMRRAGADTLVGVVTADDFADVSAAAKAAGLPLKVALSAAGYDQGLIAERGRALAGTSMILQYTPFEQASPAMTAYHQAMATYSPELPNPDSEAPLSAYVSTDEMLKGLDLAGDCPTRSGFVEGLRKVADYDAGGLIPPTDLANPSAPATCFTFVKANAAGTAFASVPPPAGDGGFWCGRPLA